MQHISAVELKELLDKSATSPLLLDVRQPWEFDVCNIQGSTLVPMSQLITAINEFDYEQHIVVICHTGVRSRSVCHYLENAGFAKVTNLSGGVHAWATQVDSSMATY